MKLEPTSLAQHARMRDGNIDILDLRAEADGPRLVRFKAQILRAVAAAAPERDLNLAAQNLVFRSSRGAGHLLPGHRGACSANAAPRRRGAFHLAGLLRLPARRCAVATTVGIGSENPRSGSACHLFQWAWLERPILIQSDNRSPVLVCLAPPQQRGIYAAGCH